MNTLYYTTHEFGNQPRMRIWTNEQSRYGQFDIIEYQDFLTLKKLFEKYHWTLIKQYI